MLTPEQVEAKLADHEQRLVRHGRRLGVIEQAVSALKVAVARLSTSPWGSDKEGR